MSFRIFFVDKEECGRELKEISQNDGHHRLDLKSSKFY